MVQGQVLLAAAFNGDTAAASFLCGLYANSTSSGSGVGVIDPDLKGAAYHAAVAHIGGYLSQSGTHAFKATTVAEVRHALAFGQSKYALVPVCRAPQHSLH